jgi:hypothetical protein
LHFLQKRKLVARKQGLCAEKASAGRELPSEIRSGFRKMGRAYRALPNSEFGMWNSSLLFPFRIPHSAIRILVARPVQEMKGASWFFRAMPLLPGRAMLEIQ